MPIITIANQKGGVGKTTLATNLAVVLANKGSVVLVDADDQQSAVKWNDRRSENKIPTEHHTGDLKKVLLNLQKKYDYVVLDVAGRDSLEYRSALQVADTLIVPTQPSQSDFDCIPFVFQMYNTYLEENPKLKPYLVINKAPANTKSTEVAEAVAVLKDVPDFKILNTIIRDRKQWRDASANGLSVAEMGSSKAKDELNSFILEIL